MCSGGDAPVARIHSVVWQPVRGWVTWYWWGLCRGAVSSWRGRSYSGSFLHLCSQRMFSLSCTCIPWPEWGLSMPSCLRHWPPWPGHTHVNNAPSPRTSSAFHIQHMGGRKGRIPVVLWVGELWVQWDFVSKKIRWRAAEEDPWCYPLASTHGASVPAHICSYTYIHVTILTKWKL